MRELGVSDKFFYYTGSGHGATMDIRLVLKFKSRVNLEALSSATSEALKLYPEYSVRTVLKNDRLYYEENHNPVAILPLSPRYDFCTDDMNGYLFCFQYDPSRENEIEFSVYHGLSDWHGLSGFLKTIICRYAVHVKGLPDDTFNTVIRSQAPTNWENEANLNPYEYYAQDIEPSYKREVSDEVFSVQEKFYDDDFPSTRHIRITLSTSQFIKTAKSHNTSFVPYLMCLIAQAIREAYNTDKDIYLALPVDLRSVFNAECIVNFSDSVLIRSSLDEYNKPIEDQCKRIREVITQQRKAENYAWFLLSKVQTLKKFESSPAGIVATSHDLTRNIAKRLSAISSMVTYPGILDMPAGADDLLDDVIMESPFGASGIVVTTYRDVMNIMLEQRYDSDTIAKAICSKLCSCGLASNITDMGLIEHNVMNLERLKRV